MLHWASHWKGRKVVMNIDNRAVVYALENRTIRRASMGVLRRCLILTAEYDLDIEARWIPTKENGLADALLRFNFEKVMNLARQLAGATYSPRNLGFLTHSEPASQQLQHTISGVDSPHQPDGTTIPLDHGSLFSVHYPTTDMRTDPVSPRR